MFTEVTNTVVVSHATPSGKEERRSGLVTKHTANCSIAQKNQGQPIRFKILNLRIA